MSAIKIEYHAQDWREVAIAAERQNVALVAALRQCARHCDDALSLKMHDVARGDCQMARKVALDAIAANKEIPKC